MPNTFVPVTLGDFRKLLTKEKGWTEHSPLTETVFHYRPVRKPRLLIKVYSSCDNIEGGRCRSKGVDAIRVVAVYLNENGSEGHGLYKGTTIKRTKNWRKAVEGRVREALTVGWGKVPWAPEHDPKKLKESSKKGRK